MAESELDRAADMLDRLMRTESVPARLTVRAVNEPKPRGRYQTCVVEGTIASDDHGPFEVTIESALRRELWPSVGDVLPALLRFEQPARSEIDWERVARIRAARRAAGGSGV